MSAFGRNEDNAVDWNSEKQFDQLFTNKFNKFNKLSPIILLTDWKEFIGRPARFRNVE